MYGAEKVQNQKIQEKLMADPNSLSTTMLINPEAIGEMSPSLPKEFPKELIPKEICEKQMKTLVSCLLDNNFDNVKCEDLQFEYYECKKWRDALIFKRINEWEIDYAKKMQDDQRTSHIDTLKVKKLEFIDSYEKLEVTAGNRIKRNRISYDIEQLSWRINYLEKNIKL
jgi:hypothetical protein